MSSGAGNCTQLLSDASSDESANAGRTDCAKLKAGGIMAQPTRKRDVASSPLDSLECRKCAPFEYVLLAVGLALMRGN